MNENTTKTNIILAYIYLAVPFMIFLPGWVKWNISIPLFILTGLGIFFMIKDAPSVWCPPCSRRSKQLWAVILILITVLVIMSGIGKLMYQNSDHTCRNSLQDTLCSYSWPVYGVSSSGEELSLVYYIGFWLPSALVGKLFGEAAGYMFMILWAVLGIAIFYSLVCSYLKKLRIWPLILFFAFSGLDIIMKLITSDISTELLTVTHLEWMSYYQYSSFTTQLFWVFNQAIPAWIATMLILLQKNNKSTVLLLGLSLINSILPFVGMLPIAAVMIFTRKYEDASTKVQWFKAWFKDTFTFRNVIAGGIAGILSFLYLSASSRATGDGSLTSGSVFGTVFNLHSSPFAFFVKYGLFILFEVLIYAFILLPYHKNKSMYYVTTISLLIIPFFRIGDSGDFCMRASIPLLVVMYLMVADILPKAYRQKPKSIFILLLTVLLIGSKTPSNEITRTLQQTAQGKISAGTFDMMKKETAENFVAKTDGSFFFKYIAKPGK